MVNHPKAMPQTQSPPKFLTAHWAQLVMLNYEVEPQILIGRVPVGTELDLWQGRCFVSMVGFLFLDTRLLGIPIPFHRNFEEVNLRFYVRRDQHGELRRGVVFVKEIVPKPAIAWIARLAYNENYVSLPMAHQINAAGSRQSVAYSWQLYGQTSRMEIHTEGQPYLPANGSLEHFISEHYYGYARQRDGSTIEYKVEHPQWQVWNGTSAQLVCDAGPLYGEEFSEALSPLPDSMFLAEGSPVTVRRGHHLD